MRRLLILPLLILLGAAALPPAQAQSDSTALGDFMGMVVRDPHYEWNTNPTYTGTNKAFYEAMGANLKQAGVKWVRIEFFAEEIKYDADTKTYYYPDVAAGTVDFKKYEYFINTVAPRYNLKVLALLATPLVYNRPENYKVRFNDQPAGTYVDPEKIEQPLQPQTIDPDFGYVNTYMHIWLANALQIAKMFPYDASTGRGIAAFEVLNEENRYLGGGGKGMHPERVADLLTKFYRVYNDRCENGSITGSCQDVKIILGGLHPDRCTDCGTAGMNDREYLDAIYKSPTAFQAFRQANGYYPLDGIGYHPYPMEMRSGLVPEPTAYDDLHRVPMRVNAIHNVMVQNRDTANKLWITEVGDRGAPITVDPAGDNEARQAYFMRSMYFMLWQQRDSIEHVFWFKYEDFAVTGSGVGSENWGVVRLQPRPTNQPCSQLLPAKFQTCEYEQNGTVQRFKASYTMYQNIAENGFTLNLTYLPIIAK